MLSSYGNHLKHFLFSVAEKYVITKKLNINIFPCQVMVIISGMEILLNTLKLPLFLFLRMQRNIFRFMCSKTVVIWVLILFLPIHITVTFNYYSHKTGGNLV